MIAAHLEPKGLAQDAIPIGGSDEICRKRAARGSAMLRDAILRLHGIDVPPPKRIAVSKCCAHCGSPIEVLSSPVRHIQATVAAYYSLPIGQMTSDRRSRAIARPRQVAMYLASELTSKSLPELGRRFGNRDHTTVMYAIRAVEERVQEDIETREDVDILRKVLER